MDKHRRRLLKNKYKEGQKDSDNLFNFLSKIDQQIVQTDRICVELFGEWEDERVEENIRYYVLNRIKNAGRCPRGVHLMRWERDVVQKLPMGVVAFYATALFEQDLCVNGSYWDFFYQSNGVFAIEALNGYKLMGATKMTEVMEQCIGAYLKFQKSGEIARLCGELHDWRIDEASFVANNTKGFDELDQEYRADGPDVIRNLLRNRVEFVKENISLLMV